MRVQQRSISQTSVEWPVITEPPTTILSTETELSPKSDQLVKSTASEVTGNLYFKKGYVPKLWTPFLGEAY